MDKQLKDFEVVNSVLGKPFSKWKNRTRIYKNRDGDYDKEIFKERIIKLKYDYRIQEGYILEHLTRYAFEKEKGYQKTQQHLIGYHYVSLIDERKPDMDMFWFQGIGDIYRFFYNSNPANAEIKDFKTFKSAMGEFEKVLKKREGML